MMSDTLSKDDRWAIGQALEILFFAGKTEKQCKAINNLLDLVDRQTYKLHKADGMANEVNILTKENRKLTAERDKYRDACERLVTTGANLVKVIEAATVIETMFVMGNRKDKAFQEVEQIVGAKNLLKWQLADAADFARQVKAELEGIEGSEIEVEVE